MIGAKLGKVLQLDGRERRYLASAVLYLAAARLSLAIRPVRVILADLQLKKAGGGMATDMDIPLMSWAIAAAAARVPWRSDCLIQSIAASRWLRRHGLDPDFRLGVLPGEAQGFTAHAWVELDGVVLTGGTGIDRYQLLISS
ncbi:MAG: lasso peptide biosynthesis B2 protein [Hyphomicrobiales bacterium]